MKTEHFPLVCRLNVHLSSSLRYFPILRTSVFLGNLAQIRYCIRKIQLAYTTKSCQAILPSLCLYHRLVKEYTFQCPNAKNKTKKTVIRQLQTFPRFILLGQKICLLSNSQKQKGIFQKQSKGARNQTIENNMNNTTE